MKRYANVLFIVAASILCAILAVFFAEPRTQTASRTSSASRPPTRCLSFLVFNTTCTTMFYDKDTTRIDKAAKEIVDELTKLHATINAFDKDSELSKLNRTAHNAPFKCSATLWDIILKAHLAWKSSDQLFDATVGPLLKLWGFHAKQDSFPTNDAIQLERQRVGFDKIQLNHQHKTVLFTVPGMRLDFGGIAKGYALAIACDIAEKHQLKDYMFDFGGNIYCSQHEAKSADNFKIGIKNPRKTDDIVGIVQLKKQCIATSGNYERSRVIQGKRIGHIMDPRTGMPIDPPDGYEGVTAITQDPTLSDVFSTTAFVGGYETAQKLADTFPGTAFIFVSFNQDGNPEMRIFGKLNVTPANHAKRIP